MRKNIQTVIEEMEHQAQLAMEQLPEAAREEMQEFDHQQELSERRWKKHRTLALSVPGLTTRRRIPQSGRHWSRASGTGSSIPPRKRSG